MAAIRRPVRSRPIRLFLISMFVVPLISLVALWAFSASLTVPDAIRFQAERDWDTVRDRCRALARDARRELCDLLRTESLAPDFMVAQMAAVRLPRAAPDLSQRLFAQHRVEIPVGGAEHDVLRLSVAAYTTREDVDRLLAALVRELDAEHGQEDE